MFRTSPSLLAPIALLLLHGPAWADGFDLARSRKNEPHLVLRLSPEQVDTVGRERKLILTESQQETLARFTKKVPRALGVESLGEPDCSCCISSALWTATAEVTIWTERLRVDPDGSKAYYQVRKKRGHYTTDAQGELFAAGRPVTWASFEAAVLARKEGQTIQLSLPPTPSKALAKRVRELKARASFSERL